ncbi:hypothetical protein J1TS5_14680 [Paenibacillus macerans]|nr:hypothetical protein J1TS5_14680 [Paenibacillus macerans]
MYVLSKSVFAYTGYKVIMDLRQMFSSGGENRKEAAHTRAVLLFWFLFINVVAYLVMSDDKKRAKQRRERIPEKTLFLLAAIGGALGVLLAMNAKRHKTKHLSFRIGVPLLLLLNAVLYGYFLI